MLVYWLTNAFNFIKIKLIIPTLILAYFYFCIKQKIFQNLLKNDYNQKYLQKYSKIHKINFDNDQNTPK